MICRIVPLLLLMALASIWPVAAQASQFIVTRQDGGKSVVYDVTTGRSYVTNNPQQVMSALVKSRRIDGFGGKITQKQFQSASPTPVQATTAEARSLAQSGLRDVGRVPGAGIIVRPLQRLLAAMSPPRQ
ncbi:MAG: hypothetical protein ACR2IE_18150 [Candidatus Sumerlaeaceae bacterium]